MTNKLDQILEQRQEDYGDAKEAFTRIGRGIGAILNIPDVSATNVALIADFIKTIRVANNPEHEDSWLDKQGYTKHGMEIVGLTKVAKEPIKEDRDRWVVASLEEDSTRREWSFWVNTSSWIYCNTFKLGPASKSRRWDELINPEFKEGN